MKYSIYTFYEFAPLNDLPTLRRRTLAQMLENDVVGTILLAPEGINGSIAGAPEAVRAVFDWLRGDQRLANLHAKRSRTEHAPFKRSKVKLKREIVTMGVPGVDPRRDVGTYVEPADWNALISDPSVTVIDTRNDYEVEIGTFRDAVNPGTDNFREFPRYVNIHLADDKQKKIAMFCTGGIRCEKSTAYLKQLGFDQVYHLRGGILNYLENVPAESSLWEGECFVFDERVTVDHDLQPGGYRQCHACRRPVSEQDMADPRYRPGISCPRCHAEVSDARKSRFAERQRQVELARQRGEPHIGGEVTRVSAARRRRKLDQRAQSA